MIGIIIEALGTVALGMLMAMATLAVAYGLLSAVRYAISRVQARNKTKKTKVRKSMHPKNRVRVAAFYNTTKNKWSIKALTGPKSGFVIAYTNHFTLSNPVGWHSKQGQKSVMKGNVNFNSGIAGYLEEIGVGQPPPESRLTNMWRLVADPYAYNFVSFADDQSKAYVNGGTKAWINGRSILIDPKKEKTQQLTLHLNSQRGRK